MNRTLVGAALSLALALPVHAQGVRIGASYIGVPVHAHKAKARAKVVEAPRAHMKLGAAHGLVLGTALPSGNSNPGFVTGQIPTAGQWNGYFSTKFDYAGGMLGGPMGLPASSTSAANLNLAPGSTPTTPNDGDIWLDENAGGLFVQVNGAPIGPLGSGGGGGDSNITEWAGSTVGAPTSPGTQGTGLFPNVNATIVNPSPIAITASSLPLPAGASTAALQTTANTTLTSVLANQTNGGGKTQVVDSSNNTLFSTGNPGSVTFSGGINQTQLAGTTLGAPTGVGTTASGNVPTVNAYVLNGSGSSDSPLTPTGNTLSSPLAPSAGAVASVAAPTGGSAVLLSNTGSAVAFARLTVGSGTATANDIPIQPGAGCVLTLGSNTWINIYNASVGSSINAIASNGLGNCPTGGGGGTSAGSGNVFQANLFQSVRTNSGTGQIQQIIAASGSLTIYLVSYSFQGQAATGTFEIGYGTGTNCGTTYFPITTTWDLSTNATGGEGPIGVLETSAPGAELCVKTTGSNTTTWRVGVAQQ